MSDSDSYLSDDDSAISDSSEEDAPPRKQQQKHAYEDDDSGGSLGSEDYSGSEGCYDNRSRGSYDDRSRGSQGSYDSGGSHGSYDDERSRRSQGSYDDRSEGSGGPYRSGDSRGSRGSYDACEDYHSRGNYEDLFDEGGSSGGEISDSGDKGNRSGGKVSDSDEERSRMSGVKDVDSRGDSDQGGDDNYASSSGGDISDSDEASQKDDKVDKEVDVETPTKQAPEDKEEKEPSPAKSEDSDIVNWDEVSDQEDGQYKDADTASKASKDAFSDSEGESDNDEPTQASAGIESKASSSGGDISDSDDEAPAAAKKDDKGDVSKSGGDSDNDEQSQASSPSKATSSGGDTGDGNDGSATVRKENQEVTKSEDIDAKADSDAENESTGAFSKVSSSEADDEEATAANEEVIAAIDTEVEPRTDQKEVIGVTSAAKEDDKESESGASQSTCKEKQAETKPAGESTKGDREGKGEVGGSAESDGDESASKSTPKEETKKSTSKPGKDDPPKEDESSEYETDSEEESTAKKAAGKKGGSKADKDEQSQEEEESSECETDSEEVSTAKKATAEGSNKGSCSSKADKKEETEGESSAYETDSEEESTAKKAKTKEPKKDSSKADKGAESSEREKESSDYETGLEEESTAKKAETKEPKKAAANKGGGKAKKEEASVEEESSEYETDSEEEESTSEKEKTKEPNNSAAKNGGTRAKKEQSSDEEKSSEYEIDSEEESTGKMAKTKGSAKSGSETTKEAVKGGKDINDSTRTIKASNFVGRRSGELSAFYELEGLVGKGTFGSVFSARSRETGAMRAVKKLKRSEENEAKHKLVLNEFEMLKGLDHPNLVKLYELFETEEDYFIVTDLCKGGTLKDELTNSGLYPEKRAAVFMKQLLACVNYFHGKKIAHRDLKPGNILLEETNTDQIRIIDFGMACRCGEDERLSEPMGTPAYMAPEVLGMSYGREADLWSCGVLLFLILSGQQPFKGKTTEDTFTNIVGGEFSFADPAWQAISEDAKDMIKKLLTWDESSRLTAAQALKHSWVVSNNSSRSIKELRSSAVDVMKNLEEFDAHSKLRLATCTFIASQLLPQSEKCKIDEVFQAIDTNSDGKLTKEEVKIGYQAVLGRDLRNVEIDQIFKNVDSGGTGFLEYSEFVLGAMSAKDLLSKENLAKVFQIFDIGNKGYISVQELKDLLKFDLSLEKKAIKEIIAEVDTNGDKKISYDEFLSMAAVPNPDPKAVAKVGSTTSGQQDAKSDDADPKDSRPAGSDPSSIKQSKETKLAAFLQDPDPTESEMEGDDFDNRSTGSLSIKLSATQFVSHRLGQLTEHYEIIDYIAKGSYGVVCSALHKETGTTRAIKELKKSKKNKKKNELLLKEFHILKTLDHPNILQMHELFEDKRHYYIVTGVSEGGDLHREIKQRGLFEEVDAAVLMKQILVCINYCHKNCIVHRDLKPGNILLEGHKKLNHIKIIDFGEAIISGPSAKLTEVAGTMAYMAPEVLGMSYGHKCDIWSCGVIAYLVLSGKQPLRGATDQETFSNIVKGSISFADPIWDELSGEAQEFVRKLLSWEESMRPTAEEALKHTWLVKMASRRSSVELRQSSMAALSNIEAFDAQSKLRVATCAFIASQLMDREEKEKIDDVFRAIDLNNDGSLNKEEVKLGYEKYFGRELSDEEIDAIFKQIDADRTGEVEYSEFLFGALDKQNLLSTENLKKAFSIFDTTGEGFVSYGDLKLLLRDSLSQNDARDDKALNKLIAQVDTDGDGKITFEDFVKMALGPSATASSSANSSKDEEKHKGVLKDETRDKDSFKDENEKSVTFSDLDELSTSSSLRETKEKIAGRPVETIGGDSSRHLQKAIARASQQQSISRSNQDPPVSRPGRFDPPSEEEGRAMMESRKPLPADPEPSKSKPTNRSDPILPRGISPLSSPSDALPTSQPLRHRGHLPMSTHSHFPAGGPSRRRISPRDVKIDEACQGFDRVQEKIARLRLLLAAQDTSSKPNSYADTRRRPARKPTNMETLDSAFTKLSQIQSKMRALQALVKSNQI